MSLTLTAIVALIAMLLLMFVGMPVAYAMLLVGCLGIAYLSSPAAVLNLVCADIWSNFSSYNMIVVPLFTFMGTIAFQTGIGERLYNAADKWLGHFRGGLGFATIVTSALFGAMCGSTTAEVATITKVALPEMEKYGYKRSLSTACIAAAGSLAILIPPSGNMIIYGVITGESILQLFVAGVIPGIILTVLFIAVMAIEARRPGAAPAAKKYTWKERIRSLSGIIEFVVLVAIVLGGLMVGWFTPSEAGGAGAAGAIVIALVRRNLTWKKLMNAVAETTHISGSIFLIVTAAGVFGHFLALTRVPSNLSMWIADLGLPPAAVMAMIIVVYLVGGCFMDALPLITLTVPIFYPIVTSIGYSGVWFGICIVLITQMGLITPPVGMNVYVIKSCAPQIPINEIFRGIWTFLIAIIILAVLLLFIPELVYWLPGLLS